MEKAIRVTEYLHKIVDEIGSRRAGTKACKDTEEFIRSVFLECGYYVDFFAIPFVSWEADRAEVISGNTVISGFGNLYSPSGTAEGEAIVLRSIEELDRADIWGKVCIFTDELTEEVLYLGDSPFQWNRDVAVQEALDRNVPASIITINPKENSVLPYIENYKEIPTITVAKKQEQEVLALEHKQVQVIVFSSSEDSVTGNVIAKTKDAKKKIVISAHYDSAEGSPGAWDNGSGVAALLELANRFQNKELNVQIEFAAMCPHEIGYPGSVSYTNTEQAELEKVLLNINIDGIGEFGGIDRITSDNLPSWIHQIVRNMVPKYDDIVEDGAIQIEGDHLAYTWNNVPAILFNSKGNFSIHHENIDSLKTVDANKVLQVVDFIEELINEISVTI